MFTTQERGGDSVRRYQESPQSLARVETAFGGSFLPFNTKRRFLSIHMSYKTSSRCLASHLTSRSVVLLPHDLKTLDMATFHGRVHRVRYDTEPNIRQSFNISVKPNIECCRVAAAHDLVCCLNLGGSHPVVPPQCELGPPAWLLNAAAIC